MLPILLFFVTTQVCADHSLVSEMGDIPGLVQQQELYHRYFMDSTRVVDDGVWDDFLAQPSGVAQRQRSNGVVFSLVSHPSCIDTAWLSIESLMRQEVKPDRIILNLYASEFPTKELPWTLQQQVNRGLEINWVEDDAKIGLPLTRSDILHPSCLINYFASRQLDDLVIIPYNVSLSHSLVHVGKLGVKEADLLGFEDVFSQFRTLGGELSLLAMDPLRYLGDSARILNPSLIEFNDKKFMTLRAEGHSGRRKYYTETFFAEIDSNYSIHKPYSLIENAVRPHEDARLAIRNGALFVSYVTDISHMSQGNGYRACMEVSPFEISERIKNPIRPDIGDNKSHAGFQKNWLYFEKDGSFLVIYNIDPLEVWDCTKSLENPLLMCKKDQVIKDWKYGQVRASTTPMYLKEYDQWLVFFHSHLITQDKVRNYFLGALTFDNDFNITSYTDKPILVSTPHIQRSLSANTILPYGCIREHDDLILSLGINDSKAAIGRLPLDRVMELLKFV